MALAPEHMRDRGEFVRIELWASFPAESPGTYVLRGDFAGESAFERQAHVARFGGDLLERISGDCDRFQRNGFGSYACSRARTEGAPTSLTFRGAIYRGSEFVQTFEDGSQLYMAQVATWIRSGGMLRRVIDVGTGLHVEAPAMQLALPEGTLHVLATDDVCFVLTRQSIHVVTVEGETLSLSAGVPHGLELAPNDGSSWAASAAFLAGGYVHVIDSSPAGDGTWRATVCTLDARGNQLNGSPTCHPLPGEVIGAGPEGIWTWTSELAVHVLEQGQLIRTTAIARPQDASPFNNVKMFERVDVVPKFMVVDHLLVPREADGIVMLEAYPPPLGRVDVTDDVLWVSGIGDVDVGDPGKTILYRR